MGPSRLPRVTRPRPWLCVAATLGVVLLMSVDGYALARAAGKHGLGWFVSYGVPLMLAIVAWRYDRVYERLGVAAAVAKPWVVVALGAEIAVVLLGDSDVERFHVLTFGALGLALAWAVVPVHGFVQGGVLVLLSGTAFGMIDEVLQGFLPDRVFDPRDVLVDTIAVGAALALTCPCAPRLAGRTRPVERGVWLAAGILVATIAGCMALGVRPSVQRKDLLGQWRGANACGEEETLAFRRDGSLRFAIGERVAGEGTWSLDSNAFESVLAVVPRRMAPAREGCGFAAAVPSRGEIRLSRDRLVLPRGGRTWTRRAEAVAPAPSR